MSALKKGPKGFQLKEDQAGLLKQQQRLERRIAAQGDNVAPKYGKRLDKVKTALNNFPTTTAPDATDPTTGAPMATTGTINEQANNLMSDQFQQIQQSMQQNLMGQNYEPMRQQATDYAMAEFNRQMAPQYKQQDNDFQQELAQRGIAYGSDAYNKAYQQRIADPRANAQQGAFNNAFQLGQGEQNQMFNQNATRTMMPFQQLQYTSPFYNAQMQSQQQMGQQNWLAGQNQMDRQSALNLQRLQGQQAIQQIRATPRGGGGGGDLSYDQRLGLLDREFYNQMVMNGLAQPAQQQGNAGNGFASGIGAGVSGALGSMLR